MTVTTLHMVGGKVVLTDLGSGFVQIEIMPSRDQKAVWLGGPELQSLLTNLRHHAQSRRRKGADSE